MREIGSEFWEIPLSDKELSFVADKQWYLSGRSALRAIIKQLPDKRRVAMPAWCCDSMIKPFLDEGKEVLFYPTYFDREFKQEIPKNCDILFVMDYFGFTSDVEASGSVVIRDVTHSMFSHVYEDADYSFGSLRKWCGIATGGFAWAVDRKLDYDPGDVTKYIELRYKAMSEKRQYIFGKTDDKSYLKRFNLAEGDLDSYGAVLAPSEEVEKIKNLDLDLIKRKRRSNAKLLMDAFQDLLIFPTMQINDCPLFVPILVPKGKRDDLRNYLIEREIYCPIHWPLSKYQKVDEKTKAIYENELSLVCDQRYSEEDMDRVIRTINSYWNGANK